MRAAGLHAIATVLETEACLVRSTSLKHPELEPLITKITSRIAGVDRESCMRSPALVEQRRAKGVLPLSSQLSSSARDPHYCLESRVISERAIVTLA